MSALEEDRIFSLRIFRVLGLEDIFLEDFRRVPDNDFVTAATFVVFRCCPLSNGLWSRLIKRKNSMTPFPFAEL